MNQKPGNKGLVRRWRKTILTVYIKNNLPRKLDEIIRENRGGKRRIPSTKPRQIEGSKTNTSEGLKDVGKRK